MPASDLVNRLEFCRQSGPGQWMARCPAHDDRGPSLSIKETVHRDTGEPLVLIHCFAGCGGAEVLDAVGLDYSTLYPDTDRHHYSARKRQERETVDSLVVEIAEHDRANGKRLSKEDVERYREARKRMKGQPASSAIDEIRREAWNPEKQAAMEKTVLAKLEADEPLTASETTWGRWQLEHGVAGK